MSKWKIWYITRGGDGQSIIVQAKNMPEAVARARKESPMLWKVTKANKEAD